MSTQSPPEAPGMGLTVIPGLTGPFPLLRPGRGALALVFATLVPTALPAQTMAPVALNGVQMTVPVSGLTSLAGVARSAAGDLFVLDRGGSQVIKIPGNGGPQTVVSSGLQMPSAVAADAAGNLYIATTSPAQILKVPASGGSPSAVPVANLKVPSGLAVDGSGNLYIADSGSATVIQYSAKGTQSTAGTGWTAPVAIASDASGNLYVADKSRTSITRVPAGNGTPVAIGAGLVTPQSVAVDLVGNLFAGDSSGQVFEIALTGAQTVVSGNLTPIGLAGGAAGTVFAADATGNTLLQIQTTSIDFGNANLCPAGQGTPAPCQRSLTLSYTVNASATLGSPVVLNGGGVTGDFAPGNGSTCTGSLNSGAICSITVNFTPLAAGVRKGAVHIVDGSGNVLAETFLRGTGNGAQVAYGPPVISTLLDATTTQGQLQQITTDEQGNVYALNAAQLWRIPGGGGPETLITSTSNTGQGVGLDGAGNLYLSSDQIYKYPWTLSGYGAPIPIPNSGGARTLAVDAAGNVFALTPAPYTNPFGNGTVIEFPVGGGGPIPVGSGDFLGHGIPSLAVDSFDNVYVGSEALTKIPAGGGPPVVKQTGGSVAVDPLDNVYSGSTEYPAGGGPAVSIGDIPTTLIVADSMGNLYGSNYLNVIAARRSPAPPNFAYATTIVGNASSDSPQSVPITNIGNRDLMFSAIGFAGSNFRQVAGSGSPADCGVGTPVLPAESCNLSISFVPAQAGLLSDAVSLSDNVWNVLQTIQLSGAGVPTWAATSTTLQVPNQNISYGEPLTMTATVTTAIAKPIGSVTFFNGQTALGTVPLDASGTATLTLTTLPPGADSLTVSYPTTGVFLGSTSAATLVTVAPNTFSLGNVNVCPAGQTKNSCTESFKLTYNVLANVTLGTPKAVTLGAPNLDYSVTATTCTGPFVAGSTCTVSIAFTPAAPGPRQGAAQITDASGAVLQTFYLDGFGVAPQVTFNGNAGAAVPNSNVSAVNFALDGSGNIYYVDLNNTGQIMELPANGGPSIQLTNFGPYDSFSGYSGPLLVDGAGNVLYANYGVYRLQPGTGAITQLLSTAQADFLGVAIDTAGYTYGISLNGQTGTMIIYKLAPSGGTPVAIPVSSMYAVSYAPEGIAVDSAGNIYVAGFDLAFSPEIQKLPAGGGSPVILAADLPYPPASLRVDAAGDVFYLLNDTLQEIPNGSTTPVIVQSGLAQGGFDLPTDMTFDLSGNMYLIYPHSGVFKITRTTASSLNFASTIVKTTSSDSPQSTQIQNSGNAPLALTKIQMSASFVQVAGSGTPADCVASSTLAPGAQCNLSIAFNPTAVGSFAGTASFVDNSLNLGSAKQVIPLSGIGVAKITSNTTLTSSLNPSTLGQPVTFTARVSASDGSTPTGTVTFKHSGVLGTAPLVNGVATFETSNLSRGASERITAAYSGNSTAAGSSASLSQTVQKVPTTTTIASSMNPSIRKQPVTFTATVSTASGLVPSGMVRFYNGSKLLGAGALANGSAILTTAALPAGTDNITAVYPATDSCASSTSAVLTEAVN